MQILQTLLKERRIEPYEAGGALAPAQQVFCLKICSKIIQSQFCIVLLNNDTVGRVKKSNANVHMEYGLMLGFNKYIIPFQHENYNLEFNVAGLDTIKYDNRSFQTKAATAIDQAISQTAQSSPAPAIGPDIVSYLVLRGAILTTNEGAAERVIYQLGLTCNFNLCIDFSGNRYIYFGSFSKFTVRSIALRIHKLVEILNARLEGMGCRIEQGLITAQQRDEIIRFYRTLEIWILVNSTLEREELLKLIDVPGSSPALTVFTLADVANEVRKSGLY